MMDNIIMELQCKDNKKAYALFREICVKSTSSDEFYSCFDDFIGLMTHESSYVRARGFCLACAQARWDRDEKIKTNVDVLLKMLHDKKPIAVRQCLSALHEVVLFKYELCDNICQELAKIDLSKYKDSMLPLIKKDMDELYKIIK